LRTPGLDDTRCIKTQLKIVTEWTQDSADVVLKYSE